MHGNRDAARPICMRPDSANFVMLTGRELPKRGQAEASRGLHVQEEAGGGRDEAPATAELVRVRPRREKLHEQKLDRSARRYTGAEEQADGGRTSDRAVERGYRSQGGRPD